MSASNVINTALIVTAHPIETSLSHTLAQRIAGKLQEQGTQVEIADLHAEGFSPAMIRADLDLYHGDASALPDDVLREQQRVERADMLIFVFPFYWWSVPALLKGWFDRVLTVNWAYKVGEEGRIVGNLRDVPVRLVATAGSDIAGFDKHGYSAAIQSQIVEGVFGFCGLKNVTLDILYEADSASPQQVDDFLQSLNKLV
ncbi:NAD(P)H-dependent oxidoreductase [Enterobacter cloacae]|jgi:NAD(P)H dehydrogenase (quinone)|uniref:Flavodoxin family protein n=1 Tax=Enterobacter cloacae TaxID=550 RepID=A0A427KLL7_ENTCL|nr:MULTISPECIES: NAD(P)H-dependent oxidoreductase [Enterobacter]AFM59856.1 NAD(P)H dehydrogenase (quinone) [Enterobacter cloacae subsp. dissolvens SDM]EKU2875456.1 NAD(P)H-dependent oxidoreductase [Enterobacter cloacae]EKU2877033.1 NAD(P)H-dependent oxidoreductase [Enterobacter cloacae]ELE9013500.1 NAD(P)H-dependent oxidoreductase [Enterobacter cloacae]ELE9015870.1 NAD(P)H-dependent oxidoreductase [Enterobacter cloacae]